MALIKSISGIRGTIGGKTGDNLTPIDAVKFAAAYGAWLKSTKEEKKCVVVLGRDARLSGEIMSRLVSATLMGLGIDVIDCGLSTTPTVEMMVPEWNADGGIILTASHNPKEWNALKLLNSKGEFISDKEGKLILQMAENDDYTFAEVDDLGTYTVREDAIEIHIQKILEHPLVDVQAVQSADFFVAVDAVNSTGGISILPLLDALGVRHKGIYCDPTGHFPHNPEPLKEHLQEIADVVVREGADLGIVVDPDVDRLALITEEGEMFGEEYTLVAVADYVLENSKTPTVSNLSSSRALRDIAKKHGVDYQASAVGEVNVVELMKELNAGIGGEGNGGIIFPDLHYGRDALIGIALFLTHLAKSGKKTSEMRAEYPAYFMSKSKVQLTPELIPDDLLSKVQQHYAAQNVEMSTIDGVKIDFEDEWVHLRKSNTEPIIRVYTESTSQESADKLAQKMNSLIADLM